MACIQKQYITTVAFNRISSNSRTFVIAPLSAVPLDEAILDPSQPIFGDKSWGLYPITKFNFHINLDDVDITKENLVETVARVVGRHGLGVWLLVCMK
jgi:hypothetical protein